MAKPFKEPENISDPPMESSEDDSDVAYCGKFVDSSDDGSPEDIYKSAFASESGPTNASASTGCNIGAKGKKPAAGTAKTPPNRPARVFKRKKTGDDNEEDLLRSQKKVKSYSAKLADEVGDHIVDRLRDGTKAIKGYSRSKKRSLQKSATRTGSRSNRVPTDSTSPQKQFKSHGYASVESTPVKPTLSRRLLEDDESSGLSDPPLSDRSDPPRALGEPVKEEPSRRTAKKGKNKAAGLVPEPISQMPTFKMPDAYQDYYPAETLGLDVTMDDVPLERVERRLEPGMALCPMCSDQVDEELLEQFSKGHKMRLAEQAKFCRIHKKKSAEKTYATMKYPKIDWNTLQARIGRHHDYLRSLIMGAESYFGGILTENIRIGHDRTLLTTKEYPTPGYYGLRGMSVMTETVTETFARLLRKKAPTDARISGRGYTGFVQWVLVPELAVKLIQEDLSLDEIKAREVMIESRAVGEILNDERRTSQSRARTALDDPSHEEDRNGQEGQDDTGSLHSDDDDLVTLVIQKLVDSESELSSPPARSREQPSINGDSSMKIDDSDSARSLASLGGRQSKKAKTLLEHESTNLATRASPRKSRNGEKIHVVANKEITDSDNSDSSDRGDSSDLSSLGPL